MYNGLMRGGVESCGGYQRTLNGMEEATGDTLGDNPRVNLVKRPVSPSRAGPSQFL